jgi:LPXTG-site transpeptidase (sortase) family protein
VNGKIKWYQHKEVAFGALFISIFFVSFIILYFFGLIPNELIPDTREPTVIDQLNENSLSGLAPSNNQEILSASADVPTRIVAPEIRLDFNVVNPTTDNYKVLDDALTRGAVHYPGSGSPGAGNMFIFGHSTGYKIVNNKAYQVFNNIHNLKEGDQIKIYSKDKIYTYTVTSVRLEKDTNAYVNFSTKENKLTLSTCNSFGAKEDRYVVEADYVGNATSTS